MVLEVLEGEKQHLENLAMLKELLQNIKKEECLKLEKINDFLR